SATHLQWVPVSITIRCGRSPWNSSKIATAPVATTPSFTICCPSVRTQYALLRSPKSMPTTSVFASRSFHLAEPASSSATCCISRLLFVVCFLPSFFMSVPSFLHHLSAFTRELNASRRVGTGLLTLSLRDLSELCVSWDPCA